MPVPPLTIRNLTATRLSLKLVESYKALDSSGSYGGFISRNFTSPRFSGGIGDPASRLAATATTFSTNTVDISIAPFKVVETGVKYPNGAAGEVLRLTFEADGERYRLDVPCTTSRSQTLNALAPQPKHEYTGIFLPEHTFLAIFSSAQLHCWMKYLEDATPLSALSIPGTHNSATCHKALPSVRCQAVSPKVQLENGVRFFDVRVQPDASNSAKLALVHGVFPISLTGPKHFRGLLDDVLAFLGHNPSETIIMSFKREGTGDWGGEQLSRILFDHYAGGSDAQRWYTDPAIPSLGQVRGRIVLMRRFAIGDALHAAHEGRGWGIDAECWADNTAHDNHGDVCVQDFYEVLETVNIEKKIGFCAEQLERAAVCIAPLPGITTDPVHPVPPQPFYLNFLNASNFWKVGCWPDRIAAKINPAMVNWICRAHAQDTPGDGGTGIVICDWVGAGGDWDLVRAIVGFNSLLMAREVSLRP